MASWWQSKKDHVPGENAPTVPRVELPEWQMRTVGSIEDGRSTSIDLPTLIEFAAEVDRATAVRRLARLRQVRRGYSRGLPGRRLPTWLSDLPELERVDTRGTKVTSLPEHPGIRWGLDIDTMVATDVDPSRVFAVSLTSSSSELAFNRLVDLARAGQLQLSEISAFGGARSTAGSDPSLSSTFFQAAAWIRNHIDELLLSQPRLESLTIEGCPLQRVPPSIAELFHLKHVNLTSIEIESVPMWLFRLPLLETLGLAENLLNDLHDSIGAAKWLRSLDLSANAFQRIPEGIWDLSSLRILDLTDNPVREVPRGILRLDQLVSFSISPSGSAKRVPEELVVPPPEVAGLGLQAIKRYWQQEAESGVDFLAEAKLLIVGEAGAGKTSLSKKILDPSYRLDAMENSTEGIDVRSWTFPSAIRVRDGAEERLLERNFRVNVWDFGGQEIYHATHQFFLTKRSVYVLVCDERKEDTDFQYWLDVVDLLSGGSPLIIVQNRKQGRAVALNVTGLTQAYPQLCGTISLNLADNDGLEEAVAKIRKEVESLPHIGTRLPKTWRDVRVALEDEPRDHISAEEFYRICRANGFTRDDDIRQLGGFLHDLGICLFFQDDDLLRKTVILKPEWGTSAVYRVLDDDTVIKNLGVFGRDDLPRIWHEETFAGMHAELVQLMVKFALCFPVEGPSRRYVAPQLLTPAQPAFAWDDDSLVLRYEYEVMPKGIVRRLIVALHDLIEGSLVWRTGVVLSHETTRAEIIEEYHRRRLRIRLVGDDPRVLLAMIDRELTLIHRSYPEIRFHKLRPCNCPTCAASAEPAMFPISDLEDFARAGDHIQCRVSRKLLNPIPLLAELSPDSVWRTGPHLGERPVPVPEVFVSYHWGSAAEALVDDLQARLEGFGVAIVRDKTAMTYRQSIRDFMRRIGAGKAVIVVLDKGYLESENCMFELTEIAARPEFRDRVFPVVMDDAGIFKPIDRLAHIRHWEQKKAELEDAMRGVNLGNLQGIREELDLYEKIRGTIAGILDVLGDMNTLTPETHRGDDFQQLYRAIEERLDRD